MNLKRMILAATAACLLGCVTINIYFPEAAAQQAADRIIDEVRGAAAASPDTSAVFEADDGLLIAAAGAGDVTYTAAISGVHGNFLTPSLMAAGLSEEDLRQDRKIDFGKELDTEAKAWKTIWSAGQGVTSIHETLPVAALISRLKNEFREALESQKELLKVYSK